MKTKICKKCKTPKTTSNFYKFTDSRNGKIYRSSYCRACTCEMQADKEKANPEKTKKRHRDKMKRRRQQDRELVLRHYGGNRPKCACCEEDFEVFLVVDHINGGGNKHKSGSGRLYPWLRREGFPLGFQILCLNCNWAKHALGCSVRKLRSMLRAHRVKNCISDLGLAILHRNDAT